MLQDSAEIAEEKTFADKPVLFGFIICAGILLPLLTLIVELTMNLCADAFFDPIPTLWHVLIVGFVPLANAQILWSLRRNKFERATFLAWISAISAGASIFYSLIFLPISPFALLGIIYFGIGLLPLSPMFSLWAILLLRKRLKQKFDSKLFPLRRWGVVAGFLIVLAVVCLSELKFTITRFGLEKAISENAEKQEQGIEFLRKYGSEDYILQLVGLRRGRVYLSDIVFDVFSGSKMTSSEKAREVYYRLTGKTHDSIAAPTRFSFGDDDARFWREKDISLVSSQMDGSIDNDASLGYLEWTFTLQNKNQSQSLEGFTQIQLPPNAVVSRLTLWIDGEEREAAFAERSRVTNAYEQVTAKKRDPVLVTTAGRDRVNLKCFPITANGGEMKMRVGITFPLILEDEKNGLVRLPYFRDKNFQIPVQTKHSVWLESKRELQSANQNLKLETKENLFAVRGNLADAEITDALSAIRAVKSDEYETVWAQNGENIIAQKVTETHGERPSRFVFVADASAAMKPEGEKIAAAIRNLPAESEVALVLTNGNALNKELSFPHSFTGNPSQIAEKIEQATFGGGTDNLPALTKAWDLANERANSAVIWIHSPQPYKFSTSNDLAQRLTRRPNATTIYSVSTASGFEEVEKELDKLSYLQSVPRFGDLRTDLERLILQLNHSKKSFGYNRVNLEKFDVAGSKETSKHLVRLWANEEINRILATEKDEKKAVELAMKNLLVTPVTGAVVLETAAQYEQFGLHPADKTNVPTIPEPEFYLLLTIVFGVLIWLFAARKFF